MTGLRSALNRRTSRRFAGRARMAIGAGLYRHCRPGLRHRIPARDQRGRPSLDRVDRLQSLLSDYPARRLSLVGATLGHRVGVAEPDPVAVGRDAFPLRAVADRRYSRHPGSPPISAGRDVRGRSAGGARPARLPVIAGAAAFSVFPRAERGFSRSYTPEDHRPDQYRRTGIASHSSLLRRVYDRDTGGHLRDRGSLRRVALSDRLDRFRMLLRCGHVPERRQKSPVHHLVARRADRRQWNAGAWDHRVGASRGQCGGGRSRPRPLWLVLLHVGHHHPDRDRDDVCTEDRPAHPDAFDRMVEACGLAICDSDPGSPPARGGRSGLCGPVECSISAFSASGCARASDCGALARPV